MFTKLNDGKINQYRFGVMANLHQNGQRGADGN